MGKRAERDETVLPIACKMELGSEILSLSKRSRSRGPASIHEEK
jgi:hypothetical protein